MNNRTLLVVIAILWTILLILGTWNFRNYEFQKAKQSVAELKRIIGGIQGWSEPTKRNLIAKYGSGFNFPKLVQLEVEKKEIKK